MYYLLHLKHKILDASTLCIVLNMHARNVHTLVVVSVHGQAALENINITMHNISHNACMHVYNTQCMLIQECSQQCTETANI